MSWIGLLLVGVAVTDLVFSARPARHVPELVGAGTAVVLAWGRSVTRGFGAGPAWLPLLVLGAGVALAVLFSGLAPGASGLLAAWLAGVGLPVLAGMPADRALLLLGVVLLQISTGNVLVRLVLAVTHTVNPAREGSPSDPATRLKGGRLLGPMERLVIVVLALAGQVVAATVIVAAKGLLRFPELQSRREQDRIHRLTEYFLVGSFASWLVAVGGLVLLG